jgi:uncharacterized membrane protein
MRVKSLGIFQMAPGFTEHQNSSVGINASGQIVGNYVGNADNIDYGYLYTGGTFTTIDDPLGANGTVVGGINKQGQIVGNYVDSSNVEHGFVYSNAATPPSTIPWAQPPLPWA